MKTFLSTFLAILAAAAVIFGIWKINDVLKQNAKKDEAALIQMVRGIEADIDNDERRKTGDEPSDFALQLHRCDIVLRILKSERIAPEIAREFGQKYSTRLEVLMESPYYAGSAYRDTLKELALKKAAIDEAVRKY